MNESQRQQRAINERIAPHVPSRAWDSTVSIVVANRPSVHHLGTGILFQIADCRFVITAAHVIKLAHEADKTIGLGATGHDRLIALSGDFMTSVGSDESGDPYDVAVQRLPESVVHRLETKTFLQFADVSLNDPGPRAVFSVFGYPGVWSQPTRVDADPLSIKPLEFTTVAYDGPTADLVNYQPRLQLLLAASLEYTTWPNGSQMEFRDRANQEVRFPIGLKGISGASVWHVGDLDVPIERWSQRPARVVGLETGVYQASGVIRASRWIVVNTLIHSAYPDLRPAIALWEP